MNGALVSGQAGVAVFDDGSKLWCVRPQSASPEPVSQGLLPYLFENIDNVSYHPKATLASTSELLDKACREERGLHLALISMDPTSSDATRELAEDALEELLAHAHVVEFIESRLYSNPLPESTLWPEDAATGRFETYPRVGLMKRNIVRAQEAVGRVRAAWDALPADLFAEPEDRVFFESVLVDTGAFRVMALAAGQTAKPYSKGEAQLRLLSDRLYQTVSNSRNILTEWSRTIPWDSDTREAPIREQRDDERSDPWADRLPDKATAHEAFQNVVRQKEAILDQLGRRNFHQVDRFVDELVRHQLSNERPDLAANSLCDLAKGAKDLGLLNYQLAWSRRAREISPSDPWVHTQVADALLSQGELLDALEVYESTVQDFPHLAVARTGKAEVLKALGRLPEALESYEGTVHDFPDNVVARTGKATVLVLLKRYEEAAALVRSERLQTRDEWIGFHILASIKLKQGRLDEADKLFSAGMNCPWTDVRSRFIGSRAVLRIKKKQLKEADALIRSEGSVISKVIQIDIYRRMNRFDEAKSKLRELRGCPVAQIVEISRDLEQNMAPGKRTVSDDEFLERELALLLAA